MDSTKGLISEDLPLIIGIGSGMEGSVKVNQNKTKILNITKFHFRPVFGIPQNKNRQTLAKQV